ncbi:MAG: hypothetical protein VKL39_14230 [Leptolyngbyaceae bacterium]|nr:hypothetical protein [Leptolyngbyaceae bacterium]
MNSGFLSQIKQLGGLGYSANQLFHVGKIDEAMTRLYRLTLSSTIIKDHFQAFDGPREIKDISNYASDDARLHCDEINRMAVVFLHSMVEEITRSFVFSTAAADPKILIQWFLARQEITTSALEAVLQEANTGEGIMSSIAMSKLAVNTEAALVQKISSRLNATLQRTSIQGVADIKQMLSICNLAIDDYILKKSEPVIAQVCLRRNLVVHNMDERDGEVLSVNIETIDEWADRIRDLLVVLICRSAKIERHMQMDEPSVNHSSRA